MPIIIPKDLPAFEKLQQDQVFVIDENRAIHQDIRPLKIAIVNLMPQKEKTESQLLRMLANTPLQVEFDFIFPKNVYTPKNTDPSHLQKFYQSFDDIKDKKYDGMIITGAPVEDLAFEDVAYWQEISKIFDFCKTNVHSTLFICWAQQAAMYHYYGIQKQMLKQKLFGVFSHQVEQKHPLVQGFDDCFFIPHSRHSESINPQIRHHPNLNVIISSEKAGIYLACDTSHNFVFVSGHSEYDRETLFDEYQRDKNAGLNIAVPENYFQQDDPSQKILYNWQAHSTLLFSNWLNALQNQRLIEKVLSQI